VTYLDRVSTDALDSLIKGNSRKDDGCPMISVFWTLAHDYNVVVFLDRVSTDANVSDAASEPKVEEAVALGWETEHPDGVEVAGSDSPFGWERMTKNKGIAHLGKRGRQST